MKVTIITVCKNSAATIQDAIESVLSQTYTSIEYIVIDGNSGDGTQAIIAPYLDRIAVYVSEPDQGIYDAMNKGLAIASGDIIGFLNADDIYASVDSIAHIVGAFENSGASVVFGDLVFVRPTNFSRPVRYYSSRYFSPWMLRFGWMPPHPSTFMRNDLLRRLKGFSTEYRIASDYELILRALYLQQASYIWINEVVVKMRTGGASTKNWSSRWLLNKEIVQACRKNQVYTNMALISLKIPFRLTELLRNPKLVKTNGDKKI